MNMDDPHLVRLQCNMRQHTKVSGTTSKHGVVQITMHFIRAVTFNVQRFTSGSDYIERNYMIQQKAKSTNWYAETTSLNMTSKMYSTIK